MATTIGDLAVRVGADTSGLVKGLSDSQKRLEQFGSKARSGTSTLVKYGAAATAAGAALAAGLVKNSIDAARETANLAKLAGTTAGEFDKLAFAARSVGVQQDKFADILKDTNDRIGDFLNTGGGPMADFFENIAPKVGVTAQQFRNLSGPQALQLYVDSLQKANVSQAEMTFYMEALASDATALVPLLRDGGAAMAQQAAMAERLGVALSSIEVEQMNQAGIAMEQAASVLSGFADQFAAELAPVITALSTQFLRAAEDAGGVGEAASKSFGYVVDAAAFVMDAIEGIKRTFEIAGKGVALFGLGAQDVMLTFANAIINKPVKALNELIAMFNQLPGINIEPVGLSELGQNIANQLQTVRDAQQIAIQDIHNTLMEPLPSGQFKQFVAEAVQASEAVAAEAVKIQQAVIGGEGEGQGGGMNATDQEALEAKLARIKESHMSELELLREKINQENEIINEARENRLITEQEWMALMREQKAKHEEGMNKIEQKASDERQKLAEQEQKAKLQGFSNMFGNLSTLMNTESRKMFEIGKAAALAGAIVDGYAAITGAYAQGAKIGGPPLGAAFGAAAAAATAAQIQSIRSASFGGGGSGPTGGSVTQGINNQGEAVRGQQEVGQTLTVQGIDPDALFSGRQLVDIINQAQKDGAVLQVSQ